MSTSTPPNRPKHFERMLLLAGVALPMFGARAIGPWVEAIIPAGFACAFLISAVMRRPLLATLAGRRAARKPGLAARLATPRAARALATMNILWGLAMAAQAALLLVLARSLPASRFEAISTALGFGIPALLAAMTFAYVRVARRTSVPAH